MGMFDTIHEPIFLKETTSATAQLEQLEELAKTAPPAIKKLIEQEIKNVAAGILGEENIAFELKNSHIPMIILRDLYFTYKDLSAQIDFLIITRKRRFVVECKNLFGNIEINSSGNFIRTVSYNGRYTKEGLYSPITQNTRHVEMLKQLINIGHSETAMFSNFCDNFSYTRYRPVVVLANPKTVLNDKYAKKEVKQQVIRADQLTHFIKTVNAEAEAYTCSEKNMERIAEFFLNKHQENPMDYVEKFRAMIAKAKANPQEDCVAEEPVLEVVPEPVLEVIEPVLEVVPEPVIEVIEPVIEVIEPVIEVVPEPSPEVVGEVGQSILCPKCGAPMIKRTAKKGDKAGNEFYGCSTYPKCRSIINIS